MVFPLPFVSLLVVLLFQRTRLEPELFVAAAIWGLALFHYILISYYDRYAAPLVGMKMIMVVFGSQAVIKLVCHFIPKSTP